MSGKAGRFLGVMARRAVRWGAQGLLMLVLAVGLLGVFEAGLRLGGAGYSTRFFLKKTCQGQTYRVTNEAFFQQFFTLPIDNIWEASEWEAPVEKKAGVRRIVILGSSAARGWPEAAYGFWRILEVMLRNAYPGEAFEVYCAAYPGVNSHAMRVAARACAELHPDLYVVYTGNNEVNGPFGASDPRLTGLFQSTWAIQAKIGATDLRLLQLLTGQRKQRWRASLAAVENYFRLEDPTLELVYRHYRENIAAICAAARNAGAPVMLCSVGANLRDWAPQKSLHAPGLSQEALSAWDKEFAQGKAAEEGGRFAEAMPFYERARALDGSYAELYFRLGSCQWALGDFEKAGLSFEQACDYDAFRSRAFSRLYETVLAAAREETGQGVYFVDTRKALMAESPHGVAGREFFCDGCHLTFEGNYILARELFRQIAAALPGWAGAGANPLEALSLEACKERLGFTAPVEASVIRNILFQSGSWNWRPVPGLNDRLAELEKSLGPEPLRSEAEGYRRALEWCGTDRLLLQRYVDTLLKMGDAPRALEPARTWVKYYPCRRDSNRSLGVVLARTGHYDEAVQSFRNAVSLYPEDSESFFEMAAAFEQQDKRPEALAMYRHTLAMNPNHERAKCGEASVLEKNGDAAGALRSYHEAIIIHPIYFGGYEGYDALLQKKNDPEGRVKAWYAVTREVPKAARGFLFLGMAREAVSDWAGAIDAYRRAVENDPLDPAMQGNLGSLLLRQGQTAEAVKPLREAVRLSPRSAQFCQNLVTALVDSGDVAGARALASECVKLGVELPQALRIRVEGY